MNPLAPGRSIEMGSQLGSAVTQIDRYPEIRSANRAGFG